MKRPRKSQAQTDARAQSRSKLKTNWQQKKEQTSVLHLQEPHQGLSSWQTANCSMSCLLRMADSLASQFGKLVVKWNQVEDNSKWMRSRARQSPYSHPVSPVGAVPAPDHSSTPALGASWGANDSSPLEHPRRNPNPITKLLCWHEADIMSSQFHLSVLKVRW